MTTNIPTGKFSSAVPTTLITAMVLMNGCVNSKSIQPTQASVKSITINHAKLDDSLQPTIKSDQAKKDALMASLVYQLKIEPKTDSSGKPECDSGVTPSDKFDSGILGYEKNASDTVKLKRGCSYVGTLKIGAKSADGATINPVYLQTVDKPQVLSATELKNDKPSFPILLDVTSDGATYWVQQTIPGTTDTANITINPTINGGGSQTPNPDPTPATTSVDPLITKYCVPCHNATVHKKDIDLSTISMAKAAANKAIDEINGKTMPQTNADVPTLPTEGERTAMVNYLTGL